MKKLKKFINREVSWLHFNERVLQEAADKTNPLIERLKFIGIFANNRDEFYKVRVGTYNRMLHYVEKMNYQPKIDPKKILKEINKIIAVQEVFFSKTYNEIINELDKENIHFVNETQLTEKQGDYVRYYFKENIRSFLFPIMINNIQPLSFLKDNAIYLTIVLNNSKKDIKESYALIEIPTNKFSRFLNIPGINGKELIIFLDDVIRYCLPEIFFIHGYDLCKAYSIKFIRDAELDTDNDVSKSFMKLMSERVKKRKKGNTVHFEYDNSIPEFLLQRILKKLKISERSNLQGGSRYQNFKDFLSFPKIGSKDLFYGPTPPIKYKGFPENKSIFDTIKKKDVMLHYPYHSFSYIIDFLREASIDPSVSEIKMTFYRAAKDSNVINALLNAVRNGKRVIVFLELQARFDEEANIHWAEVLQEEGVKVIETIPGYKVHCKLILVRRKEDEQDTYYSNISTGNYNESTAKIYADLCLFTANKLISSDVNRLFHIFEEKLNPPNFKSFFVAPYHLRQNFINLLNKEIQNAKDGKDAWVIIKLNNLVDDKIAKKIYEASTAGVKVKLIVRGICIVIPGIPEISENIEAVSIVDKFLEHARVFVFCNDNDEKYYISSADWMQRNFDRRIEVACPVYDKDIQRELKKMLDIQLADNTKARLISADNPNQYKRNGSVKKVRSQIEFYNYLKSI